WRGLARAVNSSMNDLSQRAGELATMRHSVVLRELHQVLTSGAAGLSPFAWSPGPAPATAPRGGADTGVPEAARLTLDANAVARALVQRLSKLRADELVGGRGRDQAAVCTSAIAPDEREQMRSFLHALAEQMARAFASAAGAAGQSPADCARALLGTVGGTSPFGAVAPRAHEELRRQAHTTRQRLTFARTRTREGALARPLLRWHKLTL